MNRYDRLLLELLKSLNDKADRLISLLEVSQGTKDSRSDSAQPEAKFPNVRWCYEQIRALSSLHSNNVDRIRSNTALSVIALVFSIAAIAIAALL